MAKNTFVVEVTFNKKGVLKHYAKFKGKHVCRSVFFIKLQASGLQLNKKDALTQLISCEFCDNKYNVNISEIFKDTFFTEQFRTAASVLANWLFL